MAGGLSCCDMAALLIFGIVLLLVASAAASDSVSFGAPTGATPGVGDSLSAVLGGIFGGGAVNITPTIQAMARAVTNQEGVPGDRNYRNNNPGNLKPPNGGIFWPGQTGVDSGGFAQFATWEDGMQALENDLAVHISDNPDQTITQYFAQYSPDSTGLSGQYGANVAAALGISPDTLLGDLP